MAVYGDIVRGVDMETGRARYDLAKWAFTDLADRRRYTEADPMRGRRRRNLPDATPGPRSSIAPAPRRGTGRTMPIRRGPGSSTPWSTPPARAARGDRGDYIPGQGSSGKGAGTRRGAGSAARS